MTSHISHVASQRSQYIEQNAKNIVSQWPYPKRSKSDDFSDLSEHDKAFHTSVKPSWTTDGTLVYAIAGDAPPPFGNMTTSKEPIVSEHKDIRFAKFSASKDVSCERFLS